MSLSYSQLSLYRTCPKQYEFVNVKKIPRAISAGESFGASVHNTLRKWGEIEMLQSGEQHVKSHQLALFQSDAKTDRWSLTAEHLLVLWHSSFIVEGYNSKSDADAARKRGEVILRQFFDWWSKEKREVLVVEKGFTFKEFDITGRFDRVEHANGGVRIIDYKTTTPRGQEAIDEDLQLSIYALAAEETFGLPCVELVLLFLREDGITEMRSMRLPEDLRNAREHIAKLAEGIAAKDFHPDPDSAKCGRCPYRGICPSAAV